MIKKISKVSALLVITGLLTHCAAPPKSPPQEAQSTNAPASAWAIHRQNLRELTTWNASGRLAASDGKTGGSAAFNWRQYPHYYHVKFMGAFGAGTAILSGGDQHVVLQDSQGKMHEAESPEKLMNYLAGWHIPLTGLQYWVKGLPVPGTVVDDFKIDVLGRLIQLTQSGWQIEYSDYAVVSNITLPRKVSLINNKFKVKLVIKQWRI